MFRPFEDLKDILESRSFQLTQKANKADIKCPKASNAAQKNFSKKPVKNLPNKLDYENERYLFLEAMKDVKPMLKQKILGKNANYRILTVVKNDEKDECLLYLDSLVKYGNGFIVSDTPEYIEGFGYNFSPEITKRLHRGDFSIQAHIDLHGLSAKEAYEVFKKFTKEAVLTGKRAVLIVHGRGLSSPAQPVLKTKVLEWLTRGQWRKWVIAFASARPCDGGTGATYVLLRQRPLTKRLRNRFKTS